jgi:hypothetical protein
LTPFLSTSAHPGCDLQAPFDAAVIITSILRPTLAESLRSVFAQEAAGRIQVLVGVDDGAKGVGVVEEACRDRPANVVVQTFWPGYSTSRRHGGLHPARDGGAMRTMLSYLANARRLAYLDDDNWWAPDHLASLAAAIEGRQWAWSLRWFVHHASRRPVGIDTWESVGPGRGMFAQRFGGWVDPNCLMIDKLACEGVMRWWSIPLKGDPIAMSADRNIFHWLNRLYRGAGTGRASVFYVVDPRDPIHEVRQKHMGIAYAFAGVRTRLKAEAAADSVKYAPVGR